MSKTDDRDVRANDGSEDVLRSQGTEGQEACHARSVEPGPDAQADHATCGSPESTAEPNGDVASSGPVESAPSWSEQLDAISRAHWEDQVYIAKRYLHEKADAEEMIQDTYTYLLAHPQEGKEIGPAYLNTCIRNRCKDVLRDASKQREEQAANEIVLQFHLGDAQADSAGAGLDESSDPDADRIRWLKRVVRQLPSMQKKVIELELRGRTYEEIAQRLDKSPSTVRSHHCAAIANLKKIAEHEKNGGKTPKKPRRPLVHRKRRQRKK